MNIGDRVEITCMITGEYHFQKQIGWMTQEMTIWKMEDAEGSIFVWKTTSSIGIDRTDARGHWFWEGAKKRDTVRIKATIKGVGEYKGEKQIELQRVKCLHIDHAPTEEEIREDIRKKQLESMLEGDILLRMKYSNAQEHYADCEVLKGSWDKVTCTIQVIVRNGRLKNSGTRGKHFNRYLFCPAQYADASYKWDAIPDRIVYRAVDEEHARKQMLKDDPEKANWICYTSLRK